MEDRYTPMLDAADLHVRNEVLELAERIEAVYTTRERAALEAILKAARGARRSGRLARPTPREGVEAALDLIIAMAEGGLGL